jgi:hypothetical protein
MAVSENLGPEEPPVLGAKHLVCTFIFFKSLGLLNAYLGEVGSPLIFNPCLKPLYGPDVGILCLRCFLSWGCKPKPPKFPSTPTSRFSIVGARFRAALEGAPDLEFAVSTLRI